MAVIKQGILGGFQNSIGSVVGSSWKGINVMKSKPVSVSNPRTAGQVLQRTKMQNSVIFAQAILSTVIKPLWDRFSSRMSGYNDFISTNIALFEDPVPSVPSSLVISKGKMASTSISFAESGEGMYIVDVSWGNDSGQGLKLATDVAYVVVMNATDFDISKSFTAAVRTDLTLAVTMNKSLAVNDVLHIYLAFRRADGTVVSDNSYATITVS